MPCQIVIRSVNGVVPVGGTQPTRLRVMGIATQCPGGVTLTTTPNVTAPMTAPATIDGFGRFLIDVPITGTITCGDQLGVTVTCASNAACTQSETAPLECCSVRIVSVDGVVPQGALAPTAIRVTGTLYGCPTDQVTISTSPAVTAPRTVAVDPVTGSFAEQLPITAPSLRCGDDHFLVIAECAGVTGCRADWRKPLVCPQCFRAQLSASAGPCTGMPPTATVTFTAQVGLPGSGTAQFQWDFGNGNQSAPFPVTIANGAPAATATVTASDTYAPGTYTVELRRADMGECPPVQLTFTVSCNRCPQVTATVAVGPCETTGPCTGARSVTYTLTFNPALGAGDTAYASIAYGGPDVTGSTGANVQRTGPGALTHTACLPHKPGGYTSTASVTIVDSQSRLLCLPPLPQISFSTRSPNSTPAVDVDPCLPCPTAVEVVFGQAQPPLPAPHLQLEARVVWPPPAPPPPPPTPVTYDWTVTRPDGSQAKILNGPAIVNTQTGWTGAGSTGGAVDLSQGGSYGVSVTAKYAQSAGLPSDPVTGVTSCNLTGGKTFPIAGQPPPEEPPPPEQPPPEQPPVIPPPRTSSTLCCFLIGAWIVTSVAFALLLFYKVYSYWPVGTIIFIVVGALATIFLVLWIILCCWPCALTFWSCCVLLQWQFVMASIAAAIMGMLQALCRFVPVLCGDTLILGIFGGYALALVLFLSAIAACGRLPNPFDPRTWPTCCCRGSLCP